MTEHSTSELIEEIPFTLSRISENILEVSPKLSRRKLKELKHKTATVRVYVFDDEDAERLMNTDVIDLDKKDNANYLSNVIKSISGKFHFNSFK